MIGKPAVIDLLNQAVTDERTAIHAYLLKMVIVDKRGYKELAGEFRKRAIEEMGHLDKLLDRILFLQGEPDMTQALPKVVFIDDIEKMFEQDHQLEQDAIKFYNMAAAKCEELGDRGTKLLFESNMAGEESHIDWIEDQQGVMADVGEERYLAEQV